MGRDNIWTRRKARALLSKTEGGHREGLQGTKGKSHEVSRRAGSQVRDVSYLFQR